MSFFDNAKAKLSDVVNQHGDKVDAALDKAADVIDQKTSGKHTDKIDAGLTKAKDALDSLDGKNRGDQPGR